MPRTGGIMRFVKATCLLVLTLAANIASGGPALDDGSGSGSGTGSGTGSGSGTASTDVTPPPAPAPEATSPKDKIQYGVDLRLREVFLPAGLLELFLDHVPGGVQSTGFGFDLVRRRGDLELQLGFEYEALKPAAGVYINKGDSPNIGNPNNQAAVDYILPNSNFAWYTIEFTFLNHAEINKYIAFRYGGGVGLGILTGGIPRYKVYCAAGASSPSNLNPQCTPNTLPGGQATLDTTDLSPQPANENVPPVFPVVNAILGFQIRPVDHVVINLEGGIRTLPFIGVSLGYFF